MLECPVCSAALVARFTKGPKSSKEAVMVYCAADSRHFRAFLNDPLWCETAKRIGDPMKLLRGNPDQG
jgi:hypothetical protein